MKYEELLTAWNEFVANGVVLPGVSPWVANSWRRCRMRLNPFQKLEFNMLSSDHLLATHVASFDLISIARPIMEDIYQHIDHTDTAVVLSNAAGYILDVLAEPIEIEGRKRLEDLVGKLFTEAQIGTNALSLALTERRPMQLVGPEHYCIQLHRLAGAAAPIFDINGRTLGALALLTTISSYQPHSLGIVTAGAWAIQAQRHADVLLSEYNSHLAQLNTILDTISEGILVWDSEGILVHVNTFAARLIDMSPNDLVGQKINAFFAHSPLVLEAIDEREPVTDVETNITIGQRTLNCVLSLRFVLDQTAVQWIIVNFRPIKEVRQLVQRQVGADARLTLADIPRESPQMQRVHNLVKSAAAAKASILIQGESGTGKYVLANAIHNESPRRDGPFLIFACASVPNEFVVSELLGNEEGFGIKGAGSRPGKFELAHGGSLYFQDVDNLPLEAQAILLDVLERGIVQRLGGERPVEVNVRVIAGTSAKIEKLIEQGSFRANLYYRLSAFMINLPPLRERPKDIPVLVERILKRISGQIGRTLTLAPGVMEVLKKYTWPGNIRELESYLGRAATLVNTSGTIELAYLPPLPRHPQDKLPINRVGEAIQPLTDIEREAILQSAEIYQGNVTRMALALGISRTTLWRKLKEFNILPTDYRQNA